MPSLADHRDRRVDLKPGLRAEQIVERLAPPQQLGVQHFTRAPPVGQALYGSVTLARRHLMRLTVNRLGRALRVRLPMRRQPRGEVRVLAAPERRAVEVCG